MFFATLILLLAVAPVFFVEGSTAALLESHSFWSYVVAVLASLLVAAIVTPALGLLLLPGASAAEPRRPDLVGRLHALFERTSGPATRSPLPAYGLAAVAALVCVIAWWRFERTLVPSLKETDVVIELQGPPGMALAGDEPGRPAACSEISRATPGVRRTRSAAAASGRRLGWCDCDEMAGTPTRPRSSR